MCAAPAAPAIQAAIHVRNIRLNNLSMEDALNAIHAALCSRVPTQVAFVNADCVNIAAHNSTYMRDLSEMDWIFADGIGMKLAGMMLKQPVRANVNGTDLFPQLCEMLARDGRSMFLLGGKPGVAETTGSWATRHFPGLQVAGTRHGYLPQAELPELLENMQASAPDVVLVGMGAPRQERWIRQHMQHTGATVVMAVGGLFDYYSGNIPRAPLWMRKAGLEWVWRLIQEPRRLFRRYVIGNWVFMARVLKDRLLSDIKGARR